MIGVVGGCIPICRPATAIFIEYCVVLWSAVWGGVSNMSHHVTR